MAIVVAKRQPSSPLLQKALDTPKTSRVVFTEDDLQLVGAWLDDRVGLSQVRHAKFTSTGKTGMAVYVYLALGARELRRRKDVR